MGTGISGMLILKDPKKLSTHSSLENGYRENRNIEYKAFLKSQYPFRMKEWGTEE